MRTFLVVNPRAGAGAAGRRWDRIARALRQVIGAFEYAFTDAPHHATTLTRRALGSGFELVVAVGGDGTLNEVACGFFEGKRPVAPGAVLGLIPHGTGSDLARSLGMAPSLEDACARLAGHTTRLIDAGHVSFTGRDGRPAERVFVNVVSFGCGGAVSHAISRATKRLGGRLAFTLATAGALLRYRDQAVAVAVDDAATEDLRITNYAVCNGQYFGGGMWVAPRARIDDGTFDVTIWAGFGLKDFILKRRLLYDGTHIHDPGTRLLRARRVAASGRERVLLDVDGEAVGYLPATIEILPSALPFKA